MLLLTIILAFFTAIAKSDYGPCQNVSWSAFEVEYHKDMEVPNYDDVRQYIDRIEKRLKILYCRYTQHEVSINSFSSNKMTDDFSIHFVEFIEKFLVWWNLNFEALQELTRFIFHFQVEVEVKTLRPTHNVEAPQNRLEIVFSNIRCYY